VAKLNRVNIAITGDSKGLVAATDSATKELRRLQAQAERTQNRLKGMHSQTQKAAESLGKFGLQSRGLGMASGALGLASMGPAGLALGAAGAASAGLTMAMSALASAVQQVPAERRAAVEALKRVDQDQRRSLAQFGFTRELAQSAAARGAGPLSAAEGVGLRTGMARGIAGTNTSQSRMLQFAMNEMPGAIGVGLGTLAAGGGSDLAAQRTADMLTEGKDMGSQFQRVTDIMQTAQAGQRILDVALGAATGISNMFNLWSK
jgi:hypothetical protein